MSHAIVTRGLTKYYGGKPVVHSLNLEIPTGCVYGLLGRNGAGKSTTIKMLTGMVQPDFGDASLLGDDAASLLPKTRQRIAYIAEGHPLYTSMTIDQIGRFTRRFYPTWKDNLFGQIIDHFGLPRRKRIRKLSHGQRAQVSLALAVAPDPELLILDDPTVGLDTVVRREFLESMVQIIQRPGRTILFSSHLLGDVERIADRIGIMIDGVLRVDCPTDHFKESIRKLVLTFDGAPKPRSEQAVPATPSIIVPGVIRDVVIGNRRELVIANYSDETRRALESLGPTSIDVVEMNLEDAFIEYTRGQQRAAPAFADDTACEADLV